MTSALVRWLRAGRNLKIGKQKKELCVNYDYVMCRTMYGLCSFVSLSTPFHYTPEFCDTIFSVQSRFTLRYLRACLEDHCLSTPAHLFLNFQPCTLLGLRAGCYVWPVVSARYEHYKKMAKEVASVMDDGHTHFKPFDEAVLALGAPYVHGLCTIATSPQPTYACDLLLCGVQKC